MYLLISYVLFMLWINVLDCSVGTSRLSTVVFVFVMHGSDSDISVVGMQM